ncbi:MAG: polysaccharide pyruvyl transferase family protein [Terracidiphilus sp.]|jgi:succinoglycan biosynthesis protein ExoV
MDQILKICWYADDEISNFGDDLNRWLWRRLPGFPAEVDDGTLLLGIGTVIGLGFVPFAKKYVVLSSGIGYEAPPLGFGGPKWQILSVRGPLTAAVLNLPAEKAITDGAVLLRLLAECQPLPESQRNGIAFMPHYESLPDGNWRQVCAAAGFDFLDPLADSEETVQRIRNAKLVVADAMHAAIVADTLRVPWIPVVLSPRTNTFKWLDWTLSLRLPYCPVRVPASTLLELVRNVSHRFTGKSHFLKNRSMSNAILHYRRVMRLTSWKYWPYLRRRLHFAYVVPKRIITAPAFSTIKKWLDERLTYRAAKKLRSVAEMPAYLSDEQLLLSKFQQLASMLPKIQP